MLDRAAEAFDALGTEGNEPGVRFLRADVTAIPPYQGPFDAVVFNDTLAAQADPADALRRVGGGRGQTPSMSNYSSERSYSKGSRRRIAHFTSLFFVSTPRLSPSLPRLFVGFKIVFTG